MKFRASSGCSWDWKSILWGHDLLLRGVGWRVGDGCKIIVFGHRWIPCSSNPYLILAPSGINNFQVRELIDWEQLRWHKPLIEVLFPPEVVSQILAIHVARVKIDNVMYQTVSKDGDFQVKSAYFLAVMACGLSLQVGMVLVYGRKFGGLISCQSLLCFFMEGALPYSACQRYYCSKEFTS